MPLPPLNVGDRVKYEGESGSVVRITNELGYNEYHVRLDTGLLRITARYRLDLLMDTLDTHQQDEPRDEPSDQELEVL